MTLNSRVEIEWADHYTANPRWEDLTLNKGAKLPVHKCTTIGYVVHEDDFQIAIAQNRAGALKEDTSTGSNLMVIIKSCITKRRSLK